MPWIVPIAAAVVGAAASAALTPKVEGVTLDNGAGARADAETLPARRAVEAAAAQGKKVSVPTGRTTKNTVTTKMAVFKGADGKRIEVPVSELTPQDFTRGGKYFGQDRYQTIDKKTVQETPEVIEADFTGYGDADVQAKIASQMAQKYLELGDEYGPQFIAEAKKQLELSDPQGTQARKQLFDLIQQQANEKPNRPVADAVDRQVTDEVKAGNRMTADAAATLGQGVDAANAARGDKLNTAILRQQMESGSEGAARAATGRQKALGWLTSGASPQDVDYKRQQQVMSNLASFTQGVTPTAQFSQLSGAQQGATPLQTGKALPGVDNNANATADTLGLQGWQASQAARLGQSSNWLGGLSALLNTAGTTVAAGK